MGETDPARTYSPLKFKPKTRLVYSLDPVQEDDHQIYLLPLTRT